MEKTKKDHAIAIIKASMAAIPYIGGSLSSLVGDYIPNATEKSKEEAIVYLKEKIEKLENRIDVEHVNKDEFSEIFKSCYISITRTHQKEKLKAAASLIANILLKDGDPDKLNFTELDHFSRCLDSLSIGAIEVLGKIFFYFAKNTPAKKLEEQAHKIRFETLNKELCKCDTSLLMGLVSELNGMGLIHLPGAPTVRTARYGNYSIELTPIGGKFVNSLLDESDFLS